MLAAVAEMKPRDTFKRMLSVQMAATQVALIRSGRWLTNAERVDQVNAHYSGYTKLARANVAQMEAMGNHRNGGKQSVAVQHVNVEHDGQAIVLCGWLLHRQRFFVLRLSVSTVVPPACLCGGCPCP